MSVLVVGFAHEADYLDVTAPGGSSLDPMPSLIYVSSIDGNNPPKPIPPWQLLNESAMTLIVAPIDRTLEASAGHTIFTVVDCQGNLAPDITVRVEPILYRRSRFIRMAWARRV